MSNELFYGVPVSITGETYQARFWCRFGRDRDRALVIVYPPASNYRHAERAVVHIYPVSHLSVSKLSQLPKMPLWAKPD